MGLSIHYSGRIVNEQLLEPLVEEVTDICKSLEWKIHYFDGKNSEDHLRGVSFAPVESEPVFLTFLPGGRLCSPINLMCRHNYDGIQFDKDLMYTASTKTQYAGPDSHIAIIKLLKYISGKYLEEFTLYDEGKYWETGEEDILYAQFEKYNFLMDAVSEALSGLSTAPGETPTSLADKIEQILRERFKGKDDKNAATD